MKNVMIIEDDPSSDLILREVLKGISPDIDVQTIDSAEEALRVIADDAATGKPCHLIVADIFLSGKATGLDLWQACHKLLPKTPVLVTSGISLLQFFDAIGRDTIAPAFLTKPYSPVECKQMLESMLSA